MESRRYHGLLGIVFVVAFGLRLGTAIVFQGLNAPPSFSAQPDQVEYEEFAYRLSTGEGYTTALGEPTARRPPGTSLVLLPVYLLAGRSFLWGRVWFCLLSAATCLATAWLARLCFGRLVALISATWLAVYPGHFYYPMHFLSEVPYALFAALAAALTLQAFRSHSRVGWHDWLAGACYALAILARPQLILVVPVAALLVLASSRQTRRALWPHAAVQVLALALVLAPWVARNAVVLGKPTLSTVGGTTFWGAHNDTILHDRALWGSWTRHSDLVDAAHPLVGTETERESAMWKYGFEFVRRNLTWMPTLEWMKIVRLWSPFEYTPNRAVFWAFAIAWLATCPFVVAGIVLAVKTDLVSAAVVLSPILATCLSALVFYGSIRFRDSIMSVLVVLASRAVVEIFSMAGYAFRPSVLEGQ